MSIEIFYLQDGKYKVERNDETYETKVFRHGEPWEYDLVGNKFVHSMLDKIADLECELAVLQANYNSLKYFKGE